jgi:hypothetical protein
MRHCLGTQRYCNRKAISYRMLLLHIESTFRTGGVLEPSVAQINLVPLFRPGT